jgi:uncharacterized repeat protein (TIGR03847 family)
MSADLLGLSQVDFITIETVGPPGQRTFYLQAQQGDLLVSLIIEKEHAAALALGIHQLLEQLGGLPEHGTVPSDMALREPLNPLFRVTSLGLGHDPEKDAVVIVARAVETDDDDGPEIHFWCTRGQAYALAEHSIGVIASGRPRCPLCQEPLEPEDEPHVCIRGNGHKWLFYLDE